MNMSFEERLQVIFKEPFQIKRVSKQVETLREAKQNLGLETRYSLTRGVHLTIFVQILPAKLKQIKKLSIFNRLEFKIVLKESYPADAPRLYFLIENAVELGVNPFHDYLANTVENWNPKITILDIIKLVPAFLIKCQERTSPISGVPLLYEFFQVQRLFIFKNIQTFPVKIIRAGQPWQGMLVIVNQREIILLEQTNFQNSYSISDFISILQVQSIQKHKTRPTCSMIEIKRGGSKFGVQFYSDQFDTIISSISEAMKQFFNSDASKNESSESEQQTEQSLLANKKQSTQLIITDLNIREIQSQMTILQSLVDSEPNSKNIKELVELLKKAVEYFSMKGDMRCNLYLKRLQDIMANQMMQVLLQSESPTPAFKSSKKDYESIADFV